MQASKSLRKPKNWQDFETLCKKLWSEIWKYPGTKKNGRNGQKQHGVDVYGIPKGEGRYHGIQCKGKDEYNHSVLTEKEIDVEIENAKEFEPTLAAFYFATTANKDENIEAYVRKKNVEHIKAGLFEVHLFDWDDIVDLIDENRDTHDWYLNSSNFKNNKAVQISFHSRETELTISPQFKQRITYIVRKPIFKIPGALTFFESAWLRRADRATFFDRQHSDKKNLSFCGIQLLILNTGVDPLENFKVFVSFRGQVAEVAKTNFIAGAFSVSQLAPYNRSDIKILDNDIEIVPHKNVLVGDDYYVSDAFFIKPSSDPQVIFIDWKFVANSYKTSGTLTVKVEPTVDKTYDQIVEKVEVSEAGLLAQSETESDDAEFNADKDYVRSEQGPIEDYFVEVNKEL